MVYPIQYESLKFCTAHTYVWEYGYGCGWMGETKEQYQNHIKINDSGFCTQFSVSQFYAFCNKTITWSINKYKRV